MFRIILWLLLAAIISIHAEEVSTALEMDLTKFDLSKILNQRKQLVEKLNAKNLALKKSNINGTNDAQINRIEERKLRLTLIEESLRKSLDVFAEIVKPSDNSENLDKLMENERILIIDQFQKIILNIKNEQIDAKETKKADEKIVQENPKHDNSTTPDTIMNGILFA